MSKEQEAIKTHDFDYFNNPVELTGYFNENKHFNLISVAYEEDVYVAFYHFTNPSKQN